MSFDDEFQRAKAIHMQYTFSYGYLHSAVDAALDVLTDDLAKADDRRRAVSRLQDAINELDKRLGKPWESP